MSVTLDLFDQINNAVLDLQNSHFQTYKRPLRQLSRLLQHSDLATANSALTEKVDLEAFLAEASKTSGASLGSEGLDWPESREEYLGLSLLLIQKFAEDPSFIVNFQASVIKNRFPLC